MCLRIAQFVVNKMKYSHGVVFFFILMEYRLGRGVLKMGKKIIKIKRVKKLLKTNLISVVRGVFRIYENSIIPAYVPEKNKIINPWYSVDV